MHQRSRAAAATAVAIGAAVAGLAVPATAGAATVTCPDGVWKATYYANTTLTGTPKRTVCDTVISENYGTGAPAGTTLPRDHFSIRWTTTRDFGSGGPFTLTSVAQDGVRVYVDGARRIDAWKNVSTTQKRTVDITVPKGRHTLQVDFAAWTGAANVGFAYAPRTSAAVDKVAPLAPVGASATYNSTTLGATVRWSANRELDLAGYHVYRRLAGSSVWSRATSAPQPGTSLAHTPPATGQTYYFEVRAVDRAGNQSPGSADVMVATVDRTGPAAPGGLTVTGDHDGNKLVWGPVAGAAGYRVEYAAAAEGPFSTLKTVTQASLSDGDAPIGTARYYRVRALDALGNPSAPSATVRGDGIDRTPPAAPSGLTVKAAPRTVYLSWQMAAVFSQELSNQGSFRVYRSEGTTMSPAATPVPCAVDVNSGAAQLDLDCEDTGWAHDTTYTYAVTAVDSAGNESPRSATATVRTADNVAPAPLTGLRAAPRSDGVLLSWDRPLDTDIASYKGVRGVRQGDGTVRWLAGCTDAPDDPLALLCIDAPDGETSVYAVVAEDVWDNVLSPDNPSVTTVTATELALEPAEAVGSDPGPVYGGGGWTASEAVSGPYWSCRAADCADVTEYRLSRWNPVTGAYEPLHTEPAVAGKADYSYKDPTQPLGQTSYYRIVGVRADGTLTAAGHPWTIRPDLA